MADEKIKVSTTDGDIVEVDVSVAKKWGPIKAIYEHVGSIETQDAPFELVNVSTVALNKIIEWTNKHIGDAPSEETNNTSHPRPRVTLSDWDRNFLSVEQPVLFALILAANYLDVPSLLDAACMTVADMIRGKTPEEVRQTFNIPNDLPPLEQAH